jgi:hypothetical protein
MQTDGQLYTGGPSPTVTHSIALLVCQILCHQRYINDDTLPTVRPVALNTCSDVAVRRVEPLNASTKQKNLPLQNYCKASCLTLFAR